MEKPNRPRQAASDKSKLGGRYYNGDGFSNRSPLLLVRYIEDVHLTWT